MRTHDYQGGCHCGKVKYEIKLPLAIEKNIINACNCSICEKLAYLHLIIRKEQFTLLTDWESLSNYQFNKRIAKHYFCKTCGIKSFYQPRSHPKSWSINARCLDGFANMNLMIETFDGKNWEQNISKIT